ncbi:hypothetical protein [Brachybacterium huguangmaarense]
MRSPVSGRAPGRATGLARPVIARRLRGERGNAIVEFVVLAVVLLLPCLYLVLTLGGVQSAVFAADVLARDAARIHATEPDPARAGARTRELAAQVLEDYGLDADPDDVVTITCSASPCASPGADVRAQVTIPVQVPGLGPVLGGAGAVHVGAAHDARVDRYRDVAAQPGGPR